MCSWVALANSGTANGIPAGSAANASLRAPSRRADSCRRACIAMQLQTQPICIAVVALWPSQVTTTVPLAGRADGPMDQSTTPSRWSLPFSNSKPRAVDLVPAGVVYAMEHEAPGCVCATTRALPPGLAPVTDVICTHVLGCDCAVGAEVGATLARARCGMPSYTSSRSLQSHAAHRAG